MPQTLDRLTELIGKGYDITIDDVTEFDALSVLVDYEVSCRMIDAMRLIITDPLYKGDVPSDYFDGE